MQSLFLRRSRGKRKNCRWTWGVENISPHPQVVTQPTTTTPPYTRQDAPNPSRCGLHNGRRQNKIWTPCESHQRHIERHHGHEQPFKELWNKTLWPDVLTTLLGINVVKLNRQRQPSRLADSSRQDLHTANEFVHWAEPQRRSPCKNIHDVLKKILRLFPH